MFLYTKLLLIVIMKINWLYYVLQIILFNFSPQVPLFVALCSDKIWKFLRSIIFPSDFSWPCLLIVLIFVCWLFVYDKDFNNLLIFSPRCRCSWPCALTRSGASGRRAARASWRCHRPAILTRATTLWRTSTWHSSMMSHGEAF